MVSRILPYSAAVVLSVVYFQIAQIMVSVLSKLQQTGYFGVSFRVLAAFTALPPLLVSTCAAATCPRGARRLTSASTMRAAGSSETMLLAGCGLALGAVPRRRVCGTAWSPAPGSQHRSNVLHILAFALLGTFVIARAATAAVARPAARDAPL